MLTSLALLCSVSTQNALVPDNNLYYLKANGLEPFRIDDVTSAGGLFTKVKHPVTFQCSWTKPFLEWLKRASKKPDVKLRLDRTQAGGNVIANFDLTGAAIRTIRLKPHPMNPQDRRPLITMDCPEASQVVHFGGKVNADNATYKYASHTLILKKGNDMMPADWAFGIPPSLEFTRSSAGLSAKVQGPVNAGKKPPAGPFDNFTLTMKLKSSGRPDMMVVIVGLKPTIATANPSGGSPATLSNFTMTSGFSVISGYIVPP